MKGEAGAGPCVVMFVKKRIETVCQTEKCERSMVKVVYV